MARVASKVVQVEKGEQATGPEVCPRVHILESDSPPALSLHHVLALGALFFAEYQLPELTQHSLVSLILLIECVHELLLKLIKALELDSGTKKSDLLAKCGTLPRRSSVDARYPERSSRKWSPSASLTRSRTTLAG